MTSSNHPWRDMAKGAWNNRLLILVALSGLIMFILLFGTMTMARYHECRAHGFTIFYCTGGL